MKQELRIKRVLEIAAWTGDAVTYSWSRSKGKESPDELNRCTGAFLLPEGERRVGFYIPRRLLTEAVSLKPIEVKDGVVVIHQGNRYQIPFSVWAIMHYAQSLGSPEWQPSSPPHKLTIHQVTLSQPLTRLQAPEPTKTLSNWTID